MHGDAQVAHAVVGHHLLRQPCSVLPAGTAAVSFPGENPPVKTVLAFYATVVLWMMRPSCRTTVKGTRKMIREKKKKNLVKNAKLGLPIYSNHAILEHGLQPCNLSMEFAERQEGNPSHKMTSQAIKLNQEESVFRRGGTTLQVDGGPTRRSETEYVLGFPSTTSSAARPARVTRTRSISRERVVIV